MPIPKKTFGMNRLPKKLITLYTIRCNALPWDVHGHNTQSDV
ncbi:MAG: hypothetical protein AAF892_03065 [Cyanobacteria bacterium P01_D01_bin.71]